MQNVKMTIFCTVFHNNFNGHFPGELVIASVYWSKGWWRWWWQLDYWSYKSCKAPVKSSPPTNQHPTFYRPDALPVAQPTVSKHWKESIIPWTCLPQAHLGVFQLCLWPIIAHGYVGDAPIGAGGSWPPLFEAKGDGGGTKLTLKTQR